MATCFHSFLTLPGTLPFDASFIDTDDLLMVVPQHCSELQEFISPQSSLELTDLLVPDFDLGIPTPKACTSLSPALSSDLEADLEASSRPPPQLTQPQESSWQQEASTQQGASTQAAALPPGPCCLGLHLDFDSVMSAWHRQGPACHPFQLHGAALAAAAAAIPCAAAPHAAARVQCSDSAGSAPRSLPAPPAAHRHAWAGKGCAAAGAHLAPALLVRKRFTADKRPRVKGRFVSRAEWERMKAAQAARLAHAAAHAAAQAEAAQAAAQRDADRAVPSRAWCA